MKIGFSFENLYPAANRAGRHIETLVRRFAERGHEVFIVTTPSDEPVEPQGVEILRLREAPGAKGHGRSDTLLGKVITKFLKQNEVDVHFAEGLTPLSAITVKAAQRAGAKTVIRVLADASGIVHSIGGDKRLTPSALKKRISTILRYADAAAASSDLCTELLKDAYDGDIRVIEKCVDLSICNPNRVQSLDISTLREKFEVGDAQTLIYAREEMRAETIASTIPIMAKVAEKRDNLILLVAGSIDDPDRLHEAIEDAGLQNSYRICSRLSQRDLFAAYATSDAYIAPHDSRASESELLEALAMGCPIVCQGAKAESAHSLVNESDALVLNDDDVDEAAEQLLVFLDDKEKLAALKKKALAVASSKDIEGAIDQVQKLFAALTGLPELDAAVTGEGNDSYNDSADEAPRRRARDDNQHEAEADEQSQQEGSRGDAESIESEIDSDDEEGEEGQGRKRRRRRRRRRLRHDEEEDGEGDEQAALEDDGEIANEVVVKKPRDPKQEEKQEEEMILEASARLRELDSKLTLRDLMPFLRPPKQVLVMSMASANGQHRAGDAVFEAFKSVDQNLRVKQVNIADFLNKEYDPAEIERTIDSDYRPNSNRHLELGSDADSDGGENETAATENGEESIINDNLFTSRFKNLLLEKRPHQIVLTHYLPIQFIARLKREHDLKTQIAVVITEYDLHPWWLAEGVDQYLVASEKVRFKLLRAGIPSSTIDVSGIPVHPRFEGEVDREKVRRELGIRSNAPIVLLRPGGIGNTERIMEVVQQITSVGYGFNLLILAGKNEGLVKAVKAMKTPRGVFVKAFGFVNNIGDVMGVSDLMITRAVGHTVAEAFASGLPLLLMRPESKAEDRTIDWFVERGVALKAHDSLDLEWLLTDVLRNQGSQLREMRARAAAGGRPKGGAASLCVERISRLLH
ncbi:MAG: processive 1,2-diacylglycerol beta-glucosyltransferase [Planctomycetota bacterium]|jgi:processive 1,2-diacylglycerol beta-glucosyltransferase